MIEKLPFQTTCEDGVQLKGMVIKPVAPKAVVQFNCGTAAKKEFYLPFLTYLAENGYACCLWDYRGSGESAPGTLKGCDYTYRDYGQQDMPAIKKYLQKEHPDLPLLLFVHSAGGQQVGFMDDLTDYTGMVGFGVSTGYAPNMPFSYRMQSNFFFYFFTPLSNRIFGYLKAKQFGIMEDLPRNVVNEWKAWCSKENYFFDKAFANQTVSVSNYKDIPFPIHIFWTPDDPISNQQNSHNFWKHVSSQQSLTLEELNPDALGIPKIEHFGFFKKKMKDKLWPKGLKKLDEMVAGGSGSY